MIVVLAYLALALVVMLLLTGRLQPARNETQKRAIERNRAALLSEQRLAMSIARPARPARCDLCALQHPPALPAWEACLTHQLVLLGYVPTVTAEPPAPPKPKPAPEPLTDLTGLDPRAALSARLVDLDRIAERFTHDQRRGAVSVSRTDADLFRRAMADAEALKAELGRRDPTRPLVPTSLDHDAYRRTRA